MNFELTTEEKNRYSRHLLLPEVGGEGQKKIKAAKRYGATLLQLESGI